MKRLSILLLALVPLWLLVGCMGDLPTPTPVPEREPTATSGSATITPRDTATPLPSATPSSVPTASPLPGPTPTPSAGFYRNAGLGFWFHYPEAWAREDFGGEIPAMRLTDPDDPLFAVAGAQLIQDDTTTEAFAPDAVENLGLSEAVALTASIETTLQDGSPALHITVVWQEENGPEFTGLGVVATSGNRGYILLVYARTEILASRPLTVDAILHSFRLDQPEFFNVSRANALVLFAPEPHTLDPAASTENGSGLVAHLFSGLVRLNASLQVEPDLATRWEVNEAGTTYLFTLREGLTFHEGNPITAEAFKASWERAQTSGSAAAQLYLNDITAITALDNHTLQVELDAPKPYFLYKLAQPVAFVVNPAQVANNDTWWQRPDGSGPFTLRRWTEGQVIIMDRNETYQGTRPQISSIVYLLTDSPGFVAFEAGTLDVASVGSFNLSRAQDPNEPLSAHLISGPTLCTNRIVFNVTQPPFDDPLVRQAFSLVIDRRQLAEVAMSGSALPATGILPPAMPGYTERSPDEAYNVAQALELMGQSGYGDAAALPPLTLTGILGGEGESLLRAVADMWTTQLGVTLDIMLWEPAAYEAELTKGNHNLFALDWCDPYPDPEGMLDALYYSQSPLNWGGYQNAEVDALLEQARTTTDPAQRIQLYQQVENLLLADAPSIQTVYPLSFQLVRPYVQDYQLSPVPYLWPVMVSLVR